MKVQIGIFKCTGIMGQDLVHPYIQGTTILCDTGLYVQGIYRKSPGASSKRAVKAALEKGIKIIMYVYYHST